MKDKTLEHHIHSMGYENHEIKEKLCISDLSVLQHNIMTLRKEIFLIDLLTQNKTSFTLPQITTYLTDTLAMDDYEVATILSSQGLVIQSFPYYQRYITTLTDTREKEELLTICIRLYMDLHREKIWFLEQLLEIYASDKDTEEDAKELYLSTLSDVSISYKKTGDFEKALNALCDCVQEIDIFRDEEYQEDHQVALLSSYIELSIGIFDDIEHTSHIIEDLKHIAKKQEHQGLAMYREAQLLLKQAKLAGSSSNQGLEMLAASMHLPHPQILHAYFDIAWHVYEYYDDPYEAIHILNSSIGFINSATDIIYQNFYRGYYLMYIGNVAAAYTCFQRAEHQLSVVDNSYEEILLHSETIEKIYTYLFYCAVHQREDISTYLKNTS